MTVYIIFFFNDTATTEIYTLSLHDALPISGRGGEVAPIPLDGVRHPRRESRGGVERRTHDPHGRVCGVGGEQVRRRDRKSTRLNSSHANISYAVFCLKKKKKY